MGICLAVNFLGLSLKMILAINGTLFCFLFIYVLPISIHVKCVYFTPDESTAEIELKNANVNNAQVVDGLPSKYSHFSNERPEKRDELPSQPEAAEH